MANQNIRRESRKSDRPAFSLTRLIAFVITSTVIYHFLTWVLPLLAPDFPQATYYSQAVLFLSLALGFLIAPHIGVIFLGVFLVGLYFHWVISEKNRINRFHSELRAKKNQNVHDAARKNEV